MPPKRRFWKVERTVGNVFSNQISKGLVLDLGYASLKSALTIRSRMFVRPSNIFVWGASSYHAFILEQMGGRTSVLDQACATHSLFSRISISNISSNVSTTIPGWNIGRNVRMEILEKKGGWLAHACLGRILKVVGAKSRNGLLAIL